MIELCEGSIFDSRSSVLVCPVNCVGVMGKGLALEFAQRWPEFESFYKACCDTGTLKPGGFMYRCLIGGPILIALATKYHWRTGSQLSWITWGAKELAAFVGQCEYQSIAIPALGCGLGGLDWAEVRPVIEQAFADLPEVRVELYPPKEHR